MKSEEFKADLNTIAEGNVQSLLFDFQETKDGELEKGLEAPVCQFVCHIQVLNKNSIHICQL